MNDRRRGNARDIPIPKPGNLQAEFRMNEEGGRFDQKQNQKDFLSPPSKSLEIPLSNDQVSETIRELHQQSFSLSEKIQEPVQLIKLEIDEETGEQKFSLNEEALAILQQIETEIAVVAFCGNQGVGKSTLVNLILNRSDNDGFEKGFKKRGKSVSNTLGVWMWSVPIYDEDIGIHIIILDFEPFHQSQIRGAHSSLDAKLLALAVLLSSVVWINSKCSKLDEKSLEQFDMLPELENHIELSNQGSENNSLEKLSATIQTKLVWVLRDFNDNLIENEKEITENEYLEMKLASFVKSSHRKYQIIREDFKKFFKSRELVTMVLPFKDKSQRDQLEQINLQDFTEQFQQDVELCQFKVFRQSPVKRVQSKPINGSMFVSLLQSYIVSMNQNKRVNINKAWEKAFQSYCSQVLQLSHQFIKEQIGSKLKQPVAVQNLTSVYGTIRLSIGSVSDQLLPLCSTSEEKDSIVQKLTEVWQTMEDMIEDQLRENKQLYVRKLSSQSTQSLQKFIDSNSFTPKNLPVIELQNLIKNMKTGLAQVPESYSIQFLKEEFADILIQIDKEILQKCALPESDAMKKLKQKEKELKDETRDTTKVIQALTVKLEDAKKENAQLKKQQKNDSGNNADMLMNQEIQLLQEKLQLQRLKVTQQKELHKRELQALNNSKLIQQENPQVIQQQKFDSVEVPDDFDNAKKLHRPNRSQIPKTNFADKEKKSRRALSLKYF